MPIHWIHCFSHFADLIPVSSTVIPEAEMPNKDEITAEMDQQYKKAYYSLFKKKFNSNLEKPDTLLTDKKKFNKNVTKKTRWKVLIKAVYGIWLYM